MNGVNYNQFVKKMRKLGFSGPFSGGKHLFMKMGDALIIIPNPHKRKDIGVDLLIRILKQAKVSKEEFLNA